MRDELGRVMHAYVLHDVNELHLQETNMSPLKEGEVLVRVKAAGICGSDIPRIYKTGMYSHPLIPGHEFAGVVEDVFDPEEDAALIGHRVGVFPLIPCSQCPQCHAKKYEMCENYNYLGSRCDGGFAEYVAVPKWNLIELPESVSYEQAAMLEPMAVAVHAIRGAGVKATDSVLVYGLGTIGLLTLMFLKDMGCKNLYAIGNKEFQKEQVLKLGIAEKNYYDSSELESLLAKNMDIDVVMECVGRNVTVRHCIELTNPRGTVLLLGNPSGDMELPRNLYWRILRKQLTLRGTWNSAFTKDESDDWHYILGRLECGDIHPEQFITHRLRFTELEKGLEMMRDKTESYTKVLLTF